MRSVDRPVPTIDPPHDRPWGPVWPAILHIGIERSETAAYVWDDGTAFWDDPSSTDYVWDDGDPWPYDRMDVWCKFHGLTISLGDVDSSGLFASAHVEMALDNRDGSLSQYDETGRLVDWQPGSPLDIWATWEGEEFWLFSGTVTAWREMLDGVLEVEAFDAFGYLNQFLGRWTPGSAGQTVAQRMTSICTRAGFAGPTRFAAGDVTLLTAEVEDRTPLEMMQAAALSDGGALFCDADGTVVYAPRTWITGRTDQTVVATVSDNHCPVADLTPMWDGVMLTDDEAIVNIATMANIADPAVEVEARNEPSIQVHRPQTFPSPRREDLWSTITQGENLAIWTVNQRGGHFLRLEQAVFYVHDARFNLWPIALDTRIGDLIEFVHEQPSVSGSAQLLALTLTVEQVTHDITPDTWVTTIGTTRAIDHRDFLVWDVTTMTWDDPDPRNVWAI